MSNPSWNDCSVKLVTGLLHGWNEGPPRGGWTSFPSMLRRTQLSMVERTAQWIKDAAGPGSGPAQHWDDDTNVLLLEFKMFVYKFK